MSDSLSIPITRSPLNLAEVKSAITQGLSKLGEPTPSISYRTSKSETHSLKDGDVLVQGQTPYDACWVDFLELEMAARVPEDRDLPILASVTTRGNPWFTAAVAYALAKHLGGRAVYDDSHILQGIDRYVVDVLYEVLREGLQGTRRRS